MPAQKTRLRRLRTVKPEKILQGPYARYKVFQNKVHLENLAFDKPFLGSIGPNTRMLEIGYGSGRLTDYLLRSTRLAPGNLTIVDFAFPDAGQYQKKRVFLAQKTGRIKRLTGNYMLQNYPKNHFDHIILPESFFNTFKGMLKKLAPALKTGGTLRISFAHPQAIQDLANAGFFEPFGVTVINSTRRGVVLRKN